MYEFFRKVNFKHIKECVKYIEDNYGEEGLKVINEEYKNIYIELLNSNAKLNPLSITELSGPSTFIYYNNVYGKRILLLGETHIKTGLCVNKDSYEVQDWLYNLSLVSNKCLDIFVEFPLSDHIKGISAISGKNMVLKSTIGAIERKFDNFKSETTRYHRSDPRTIIYIDIETQNIILYRDPLNKWLKAYDSHIVGGNLLNKVVDLNKKYGFSNILAVIIGLNRDQNQKLIYFNYLTDLFNIVNIKFQVDLKWETLIFDLLYKRLDKLDKTINLDEFLKTMIDIYIKNFEITTIFLAIRMDIYLLTRLFTEFKPKNRGPELCQSTVENAIIYAGSAHIYFYHLFFQKFFKAKSSLTLIDLHTTKTRTEQQCIKFNKPFNYWKDS